MKFKWTSSALSASDFVLVQHGHAANILTYDDDFELVQIAASHLAADIAQVVGVKPRTVTDLDALTEQDGHAVIVGTLGHSAWIDTLIAQGKLDASRLAGQWESFFIAVIDRPFANVARGLVIVGSDRRGTAYGVFELSERIGISPWTWWADVPCQQHDTIYIEPCTDLHGPPAVKYRGIFINDEDWSLREWASLTFAPEEAVDQKGLGPCTHEKIFELMLRLRANLLWPAMHPGTKPFNDYPENKILAHRYGIVMGSSHCEPMLRNNVGEWDTARHGEWNYKTNRETMLAYWTERVRENGQFENVYTLGMRGIHDDPMPGMEPLADRVARLSQVIADQRKILCDEVNFDVEAVPQVLCVYKEVLDLYRGGLNLPADVITVWSDDNYGYITNLPSPEERARGQKAGVYYHISYWGRPHDYLWLDTTPLALIWSEMHKAYVCGAQDLWVANVGGVKAHEIGTEYFLKLAWYADQWDATSPARFLSQWATSNFGLANPQHLGDLLTEYYRLCFIRKPEHMGWNKTYPETQNSLSEFSPTNYGDEIRRHLDQFEQLTMQIDGIYQALPEDKRAAFYQIVVYPVRCASLMCHKFLYAQKSQYYAAQGRASAATYAQLARQAFESIHAETVHFNQLSNGKWQHIMCDQPRNLPVFAMPAVAEDSQTLPTALGIVVEGADLPDSLAGQQGANNLLPPFNRGVTERHFIDLYNSQSSGEPIQWSATSLANWLRLSAWEGLFQTEQRLWVSVDWDLAPKGDQVAAEILFTAGNTTQKVRINLYNPANPAASIIPGSIVEANSYVSFHAARFTASQHIAKVTLQTVPGLGRTGAAVAVLPLGSQIETNESSDVFVTLDYQLALLGSGTYIVRVHCLPTHPIHAGRGLRLGIAFDDQPPQVVDITANGGEHDKIWQGNVLRGAAIALTRHKVKIPGLHTLHVGMLDPGLVLDKIVIDAGGERPSYLGPPETICR